MNKKTYPVPVEGFSQRRPLIEINDDDPQGIYVPISHAELDSLVGSLIHLMELNTDKEYREAMKSEIKLRAREWLSNEYSYLGYRNCDYIKGARVVVIEKDCPINEMIWQEAED